MGGSESLATESTMDKRSMCLSVQLLKVAGHDPIISRPGTVHADSLFSDPKLGIGREMGIIVR